MPPESVMTTVARDCMPGNSSLDSGSRICSWSACNPKSAMRFRVRGCAGNYDGKILADLKQRLENALQNYAVVDIGRTVQGDQCIALGKPVSVLTLRRGQKPHERINHNVADAEDSFGRNSFFLKINVSVLGRRKEHISQLIGDQPVDFLRHGAIEGA